jgi:integrase
MKVTIRKRLLDDGERYTLRLDIYQPVPHPESGKMIRFHKLGMYLQANPKTSEARAENKRTKTLADAIRAKVELQLQAGEYGFLVNRTDVDFIAYYKKLITEKVKQNTVTTWKSALHPLLDFAKINKEQPLHFSHINRDFMEKYKAYLLSHFSQNSASVYFSIFRAALNHAYQHDIIKVRVTDHMKPIPGVRTKIVYLTGAELKALYKTPCGNPTAKKAALFSALTGMRYSDLKQLRWEDIGVDDNGGHVIHFRQKKTGTLNYLPISSEALSLLGKANTVLVFPFLTPNIIKTSHNTFFARWLKDAFITKLVTFHTFRHTFTTLQLYAGTSINIVSAMLGHADLKTTMIYAHVVDESRRAASSVISLED